MFEHHTIHQSPEFDRIRALPKRAWTVEQGEACAKYYTARLRTPTGTMTLRPIQAIALHELSLVGGLLAAIRVGGGKTLISLLAAAVLPVEHPLLLLPAALLEKTKRDLRILELHWRIPIGIVMQSYDTLGRDNAAHFLDLVQPDIIISDESHRLKNHRAGVTRRVVRYMQAHPETRFVAMSGTLLKNDIRDLEHLSRWCLKDGTPMPRESGEVGQWAEVLGRPVNPLVRTHPGPLVTFATEPEDRDIDPTVMARKGFRRRLLSTPGVVASGDDRIACSLLVKQLEYKVNEVTEQNFATLRGAWETPDGWALSQATDVWRHARELALGFHSIWDPRPPSEWLNARRAWASYVREVLGDSRTLDTEYQVGKACEAGALPRAEYDAWKRIEPTFQVQPRPIWHDDGALVACERWMKKTGAGIVWTEHVFFARELARRTGASYFGEEGLDDKGIDIESVAGTKTVIASIRANGTGRNLQAWSRNLVTSCPVSASTIEQMIGRTHRDGQQADVVEVDILLGCREHYDALVRAIEAAKATEQTLGHEQKILIADVVWDEVKSDAPRWASSS